ncbi:metallophosphoesterase [Sphingomonas sp. CGMCC 1.13654]|uniref:Metallophosphoesterase n=1 Tax=Sphingomonas chungangi TaxID=2683589 RepID=A0A838L6F9_9SPHN|nr:metallophosphoesterase [Sphingomonas chungangi]MBA2933168.1 metallophosphoesterase [Sphingomonas chungangi]MVW57840.1 serine/threonine protein phosphatase [Sphingomonas chungangi]
MLSRFLRSSQPTVPPGHRVYAIGDVHGRADLLDRLLDTLQRDNADRCAAQTSIVFLGDLIDRGPDSRGVVSRVRAGVDWARTITLMGNHESIMLDVLDGRSEMLAQWLRFGGIETLESWGIDRDAIETCTRDQLLETLRATVTTQERAWFGRLRTNLRMGDYYFVHAGVRPDVPLDKQDDEDRLWIREDFLESRKKHGAMIVHGHSVNSDVENLPNRIGLDTGAYATGKLTAVGLEGRDRWFLSTVPVTA